MQVYIPDRDDVQFVMACSRCGGEGVVQGRKQPSCCPKCMGSRRQLTEAGERLLKFLLAIGVHVSNLEGWHNI